jgi:hypothetical protein
VSDRTVSARRVAAVLSLGRVEMRRISRQAMLLAVCCSVFGCSRTPPQASAHRPYVCRSDFDRARELVEHSYAGYRDKLERLGPATILTATRLTAERTSGLSPDDPACTAALDAWLGVLADGHLFVRDLEQRGMRKRPASRRSEPEVTFRLISGVAVLRIQTFEDADAVVDVVQQHRGELTSAERLIIDLRGNGGGSDAAFAHLVDFVYSGPYQTFGSDVLATEDNAAAWERLIPELPPSIRATWVPLIENTVARMRAAPGRFVSLDDNRTVSQGRVLTRPAQVDLFYDRRCASSCEEFVLAARQSAKVTTFGTHSAGVIDYGNVRSTVLPTRRRSLFWPTSRSRRLPEQPIDGAGIPPEVRLDPERLSQLDAAAMIGIATDVRNPNDAPYSSP